MEKKDVFQCDFYTKQEEFIEGFQWTQQNDHHDAFLKNINELIENKKDIHTIKCMYAHMEYQSRTMFKATKYCIFEFHKG